MGWFPKIRKQPKVDKKAMRDIEKHLNLEKYATHDEIEQVLNDRAESERRRELLSAMSPRLRLKVLRHIAERKAKNGKK